MARLRTSSKCILFLLLFLGLVMAPSHVLVYLQMAQFLMLVMFVSWVYSTLFFLPLCAFIGPSGNTGQLTCKKVKTARKSVRKSVPAGHSGKADVEMEHVS